jgi:glutathione synthase/RimK-type ligase-like ATP-grasp enzyme
LVEIYNAYPDVPHRRIDKAGIMKIAILRNEDAESGDKWLFACQNRNIEADVIDLCSIGAIEKIKQGNYDLCLLRPPGRFEVYKSIYDERLYHVSQVLKIPCFPSFFECFIYENKRSLAAFLQAAAIDHPETWVISQKDEAQSFISQCKYPVVAKTSIGAAGSGVKILRDKASASKYVRQAFVGKGIQKRTGPNPKVGSPKSWLKKAIASPDYFKKKLKYYAKGFGKRQRDFVIFQEYIEHGFEWRVARIGESYFAYKKYKVGDKASGAQNLGYANPPLKLLTFIKEISDKHGIVSAAFDVFEYGDRYLINEIQAIFGHKMDHILEVDDRPGRYLFRDGSWVFEEGTFNTNESYDLRLEVALRMHGFS